MAVAPVPGELDEASKFDATLKLTGVGEMVNCAVGAPAGGRMTPIGTRRMVTVSGFAVVKFVAVAVATIDTQLPGSPEQVPNSPLTGLGGAVYTAEATPSLFVTIVRADSVP